MKKCTRCGCEKDESEFQIRNASKDGLTASCKRCLSDYDKSRANNQNRVKARMEYSKTDGGKIAGAIAKKKYIDNNPIKRNAHVIVGNAIRDKKLFHEPCESCSSINKVHAHHDDYAKPLNVRWLCPACHKKWHIENGEGKNAY